MINENNVQMVKHCQVNQGLKFKRDPTLFDQIGYKTSLEQYMIRSKKIRWLTYNEDMKYWDLWDKKNNI